MIPDFKTFLRESVWSDMEDRGTGISVKAEDELVELKNKLNSFYVQSEPFIEIEVDDGCLSMPLFRNKFNMISSIHIKDRDYVVFNGMNPKGYHFNKYMMPLKTDTEEIYSMFENTYKFEKEESDGMEHWIRYELRMKNGSKFTNDECFKLIENIFNMVTDKKEFTRLFIPRLRESVWSDMEERGTGDLHKKEDGPDKMKPDQFLEYLQKRYVYTGPKPEKYSIHKDARSDYNTVIWIPIYQYKDFDNPYFLRIDFHIKGKTINKLSPEILETENSIMIGCEHWFNPEPKIFDKLDDAYGISEISEHNEEVDRLDIKYWNIRPWKMDELSNSYFVEVIDYIRENLDTPLKCVLELKKPVQESVWSDMEDRGTGDKIKSEDELDNKTFDGFCKYWSQRYSIIKNSGFKSMEHIHNPKSNREQLITPIELNKESGFSYTYAISMFYNSNTDQIIDFKMDYGDMFLQDYPQLQEVLGDEYIVDDEYIRVANGDYKFHHYIDILDKCLNMVKKPSVRINESIWSDMEDRGNGDLEKLEDSVDTYEPQKFYQYLVDHFKTGNRFNPSNPFDITYNNNSGFISIPVIQHTSHNCYTVCANFNYNFADESGNQCVTMNIDFKDHAPKLYEKMKQAFKTSTMKMSPTYTRFVIYPADGTEYTNSHYINVINFIIENIDDEKLLICHHK